MNLLVHFVIYGHSWCFESCQIALAYGSCNFENFQNITRAHKSRNALAPIRFPILISPQYVGATPYGNGNENVTKQKVLL